MKFCEKIKCAQLRGHRTPLIYMLGSIVYLIWILLLNIETKLKLKQDSSTLAFPIPRQTTLLFKYKWKRIKIYFTINSLIICNNPINPRWVFSFVDWLVKNLIFFSFFLQWKSSVLYVLPEISLGSSMSVRIWRNNVIFILSLSKYRCEWSIVHRVVYRL